MRIPRKGSIPCWILVFSLVCCLATVVSARTKIRGLRETSPSVVRPFTRNNKENKDKNNKDNKANKERKDQKDDNDEDDKDGDDKDEGDKDNKGEPAETQSPTNRPTNEPTNRPTPSPTNRPTPAPTNSATPPASTPPPPPASTPPPSPQPSTAPAKEPTQRPTTGSTPPPTPRPTSLEFNVPLKRFSVMLEGDLPERDVLEQTTELFLLDAFQSLFDYCKRVDLTEVAHNVAGRHGRSLQEEIIGGQTMEVEYTGDAFFSDLPLPDQDIVWDLQEEALEDTGGFEAALYTNSDGIVAYVQTEMLDGSNGTSSTQQQVEGIDPDPMHTMRIVGIILFIGNAVWFVVLQKLSRRRQRQLELEAALREDEYGGLVTQEGLDYLLSQGRVTETRKGGDACPSSANNSVLESENRVNGRSPSPTPFAVPTSVALDYPESVNFPALDSDVDGSELSAGGSGYYT